MDAIPNKLQSFSVSLRKRYDSLSTTSKVFLWIWVVLNWAIIGLLIFVGPSKIFNALARWAQDLRSYPLGWVLLMAGIVITSFPPLIGYGTLMTICGFAYGAFPGWFIAGFGCLLGAGLSFLVCRRLFKRFARYLEKDKTFRALGIAVRSRGLFLVVLIRLCPFPFPYSNLFFASIESVSFLQFMIATLAITPKLLLHVWIGSRMYVLADKEQREKMDPTTKVINALYIIAGSLLGLFTSIYVWRVTRRYVSEVALGDDDTLTSVEREELLDDLDTPRGHDDDPEVGRGLLGNASRLSFGGDDDEGLPPRETERRAAPGAGPGRNLTANFLTPPTRGDSSKGRRGFEPGRDSGAFSLTDGEDEGDEGEDVELPEVKKGEPLPAAPVGGDASSR